MIRVGDGDGDRRESRILSRAALVGCDLSLWLGLLARVTYEGTLHLGGGTRLRLNSLDCGGLESADPMRVYSTVD